jgi:hypothetical protein
MVCPALKMVCPALKSEVNMYCIAALTLVLIAIPRDAAAYIDPSAGSIILQLLLGGPLAFW